MRPETGLLIGPYRLLEQIGEGGMGVVWRARDTALDRDVAIKFLPPAFAHDPERGARFRREAKAVAALSHPGILAIYGFGEHEGSAYAVTELLEGRTLRAALADGAPGAARSAEIARQVARALASAHDRGILHRDLKPENVFLTRDGHVKILDFGLAAYVNPSSAPAPGDPSPGAASANDPPAARPFDASPGAAAPGAPADVSHSPTRTSLTSPGTLLGTTDYLSPEQVRGAAADARSDVFSFGLMLHEMLTGRHPFRRETPVETMTAILRDDPPVAVGVPPALAAVARRCLAKSPAARFASARDLASALDAAADATPAARRARVVPAVLGAAAVVVALAGLTVWRGRAPSDPRAGTDPGAGRDLRAGSAGSAGAAGSAANGGSAGSAANGGSAGSAANGGSAGSAANAGSAAGSVANGRGGPARVAPPATLSTIGEAPSPHAEANEYFEKGLLFIRAQLDIPRAQKMMDRAIAIDPDFGSARAIRTLTNVIAIHEGFANDAGLVYASERDLRDVLARQPELGSAHAALGATLLYLNRKEQARQALERSVQLNPQSQPAFAWLTIADRCSGRFEAAETGARRILAATPLFWAMRILLSDILFDQGRIDEAHREIEKVFEQDSASLAAVRAMARVHLYQGDTRGARALLEGISAAAHPNFRVRLTWALLLAREGDGKAAVAALDTPLLKYAGIAMFAPAQVAEIYALSGRPEEALDWLDRAARNGDERAAWFRRDAFLAGIRSQPRFHLILDSIGGGAP